MRSSAATRRRGPVGVIRSSPMSVGVSRMRATSRRVLMGAGSQRCATSVPGSMRPRRALGVLSSFSRFSRRSMSASMVGSDRAANGDSPQAVPSYESLVQLRDHGGFDRFGFLGDQLPGLGVEHAPVAVRDSAERAPRRRIGCCRPPRSGGDLRGLVFAVHGVFEQRTAVTAVGRVVGPVVRDDVDAHRAPLAQLQQTDPLADAAAAPAGLGLGAHPDATDGGGSSGGCRRRRSSGNHTIRTSPGPSATISPDSSPRTTGASAGIR